MNEISVFGLGKKGRMLKKHFSVKAERSEQYLIFDAVSEIFPFFKITHFKRKGYITTDKSIVSGDIVVLNLQVKGHKRRGANLQTPFGSIYIIAYR